MKCKPIFSLISILLFFGCSGCRQINKFTSKYGEPEKVGNYYVYDYPTPNRYEGKNDVKAIVLHHTATPGIDSSLDIMSGEEPKGKVSCHVVIDKDGTRYVLAPPEAITWHAGFSSLNGRENCNKFCVGIEFQGNTLEEPLTDGQIESAIDYCLPIMKKYNLRLRDIVSHEQIRAEYKKRHPKSKTPPKPDIVSSEMKRFKDALQKNLKARYQVVLE